MRLTHAGFASGRAVGEGEALARLDAESLAVDLRAAEARVRGMMVASHEARIGGDPGAAASSAGQARAESRRLQLLSREIQRADLRAPFAGTVMSFSARALEGERLEPGDTVCVVGDFSTVRAVARVSEFDLEDLEPGAPARVRLRSDPTHLLTGRVSAIEQSGVAGGWKSHRVWIALDHAPAGARAGLTGVAHIRLPARTPATQIVRALVRFVRLDLWV
jgi:multidrug resistance efflux pump